VSAKTPHFWQSKNTIALALFPLSLLFRGVVAVRHQCYRWGLFKQYKVDVPVVVVGNISAGGAGKTPLVIALAQHLQQHCRSIGILCGGYGGSARGGEPVRVDAESDAACVGDEALMIARQTGLPVVVAKDRVAGARLLQTECACIVCDDGLQHYRLQRDVEIAVVNAAVEFGNGFMLPAGPLREPVRRLHCVDLICVSGEQRSAPGYSLQADALVHVRNQSSMSLDTFRHQRVHAVAGIAYPGNFFNMLRALGFEVVEHALPDHSPFNADTLRFEEPLPIIMTEKDSVKCRSFAPDNAWFLSVHAVPDPSLLSQFDQLMETALSE
jgi:tetraacyldisaccharide 4'-kinase